MSIKRMSIQAFKSYNQITDGSIEFSPGINVIVGDNGCGKSNLFEALMYVLTDIYDNIELSEKAKLVCESTKYEKMYVELVLSNVTKKLGTDSKEVPFRRQFNVANKTEEFFITSKKFPKWNYREFLEQASILCKNPFFYIKQETINELVMMTDIQLLDFLAQAIGIKAFHEKKESLKTLILGAREKKAKLNVGINKLISYLSGLDPDKKKMIEYNRLMNEKNGLEITLIRRKMHSINKELTITKSNYSKTKEEYDQQNSQYNQLLLQQKEILANIRTLDSSILQATQALNMKKIMYDQTKTNNITVEEENKRKANYKEQLKANINTNKLQISTYEKELPELETELSNAADKLPSITKEIELIEKDIDELKSKRDKQVTLLSLLNDKVSKKETLQNAISEDEANIKKLKETEQIIKEEVVKNEDIKLNKGQSLNDTNKNITETENSIQTCNELIQSLSSEANELISKIKTHENQKTAYTNSVTELNSIKEEKEATILKNLHFNYGIFREFIESIEKLKLPNYIGLVTDYIEIPQQYRAAFDCFGSPLLYSVVVKDVNTAELIIEEASKNSDLLVNVICLELLSDSKHDMPGLLNATYLTETIKYKEPNDGIKKVINASLRKIIIVENAKLGIEYSVNYKVNCFIMSESRAVYSGGFSGSVGSNESSYDIYSSFAQLKEIHSNITINKKELLQIEEVLRTSNEKTTKTSVDISYNRSKLQELSAKLISLKKERDVLEMELSNLNILLRNDQNQLKNITQENEQFITQLSNHKAMLKDYSKINLKDVDSSQLSDIMQELKGKQSDALKQHSLKKETEGKIITLTKQIDNIKANLTQCKDKHKKQQTELEGISIINIEKDNGKEELEEKTQELKKLQKDKEEQYRQHNSTNKKITDIRIDSQKNSQEMEKLFISIEELRNTYDDNEKKLKLCKGEQIETTKSEKEILAHIEILKKEASKCQIMESEAIRQYNHINSAKTKIEEQVEECDKSISELESCFKLLEEQEEKSFLEETSKISENFNNTIKSIIPHSQGLIKLLETPVDNISQNQFDIGAKSYEGAVIELKISNQKQLVSHLSGGQKTAVALSLLFSLQETQPSPIYIFDEVDAALDANSRENYFKL